MPIPNLGYDKPSEASIDSVNQWMRQQPWYQEQMQAWGQDPGHPNLSKTQSQQILKAAQAQGVIVDEGDMEVDDHGNFNPKGHKLRNTLLVAGIAGAALATAGLAGAFGGAAAGGGAGAAGATGAAGGVLPSVGGLTVGALPAGLAPVGMAGGAATGLAGAAGTAAAAGGGGTLSAVGKLLSGSDALGVIGKGISNASSAAGNTRRADYDTNVLANNSNIQGQSAFENELMKRASMETDQSKDALKNIYRSSYAQNAKPGPYNPAGTPGYSAAYLKALKDLEAQGASKIAAGPQYDVSKLPPLQPYTPIQPTRQSTLEQVGSWAGPITSTLGAVGQYLRR